MAETAPNVRGIRPQQTGSAQLTSPEVTWVQANSLLGTPVENEDISSQVNGVATAFTLANTPVAGSVKLYYNGSRLTPTSEFTVSGATVTTTFVPESGSSLLVDYRK